MQRSTPAALFFFLSFLILIAGCGPPDSANGPAPKELLVYCGITMIKPMSEIAAQIEAEENCRVIVTKGGSGNLLQSIRVNQVGDLFLPGSDAYIETCRKEGLVVETAHVGYNKAALMVPKGNPKGITPDLDHLMSKAYYVVIGDPASGSIGKETKRILERKGIFEPVLANARRLTTDSKDLINVLRNREADLVVNWYATATWPENRSVVDVLPIDEAYATPKKLVLGLLKTSRQPEIARKFIGLAISEKGRAIFKKYGLYDVI